MVTDKQRGMRRFAKGHGPKLRILINILEQRLIQEAAEHDNASIETTQIEEICHSLSEDISTLSNLVYQILDAYHNWDEQEEFQHKRKDVLGRLLVNEFEYMLEGRGGELPRIAISGILRSFRGLVGVEIFEELKITVNTLHQKITKEMGEGAPAVAIWKKFFAHPGAKLSLIRVSVRLSTPFQKYRRRKQWMVDFINVHIGPLQKNDEGDPLDEIFEFTENHFVEMMTAFVQPAKDMLENQNDLGELRANFSNQDLDLLSKFVSNLFNE